MNIISWLVSYDCIIKIRITCTERSRYEVDMWSPSEVEVKLLPSEVEVRSPSEVDMWSPSEVEVWSPSEVEVKLLLSEVEVFV